MTKPDAMAARKKVMEENGPLADLEQNEDGRGWFQPLLKTTSEAADRNSLRTAYVPQRPDEKREQKELRTGAASPPAPASPPGDWRVMVLSDPRKENSSRTPLKKRFGAVQIEMSTNNRW